MLTYTFTLIGASGKSLPSIPTSEDQTIKINGGSLKRTDVEERRGSPVSGAKGS